MADPSPALSLVSPDTMLASSDRRLVDVLDSLLDKGVVIRGELWLTVADVELVFLGIDAVLTNPDRMRGEAGGRQ